MGLPYRLGTIARGNILIQKELCQKFLALHILYLNFLLFFGRKTYPIYDVLFRYAKYSCTFSIMQSYQLLFGSNKLKSNENLIVLFHFLLEWK